MHIKDIKEVLESFVIILNLMNRDIEYELDYDSIRVKLRIDDIRTFGNYHELLIIYILEDKCVVHVNELTKEKYNKITIKAKKLAYKNKEKISYHNEQHLETNNIQLVIKDYSLVSGVLQEILEGILVEFDDKIV